MVNTHKFLPDTNQLRIACLNSSKVSSISGYNLNESSEDGSNGPHPDMSAFVNAIVSTATTPPPTNDTNNNNNNQKSRKRGSSNNKAHQMKEEDEDEEIEFSITPAAANKPDTNNNPILESNSKGNNKTTSRGKRGGQNPSNGSVVKAEVIEVVEPPQTRRSKRVRTK